MTSSDIHMTVFIILKEYLSFKCKKKRIRFSRQNNAKYQPPRDKINKMTVHPAKTKISLGIRPVWSVFTGRSVGS